MGGEGGGWSYAAGRDGGGLGCEWVRGLWGGFDRMYCTWLCTYLYSVAGSRVGTLGSKSGSNGEILKGGIVVAPVLSTTYMNTVVVVECRYALY